MRSTRHTVKATLYTLLSMLWGQVLQSHISKNKRGVIHQNKDGEMRGYGDGEIEKNFKFQIADIE